MNEKAAAKPTVLQRLSLYDIALEGKLIEDILVEGDGELTPETEARLVALLVSGKPKIEGACLIIKELEASESSAKKEAARMAERQRSFERNAESLKARVVAALDTPAYNGKVKTDRVTTWTQKTADSLVVEFEPASDTLENLFNARPDLVRREYVYTLDVAAVKAIYEEEASDRNAFAAELAEYEANILDQGEGDDVGQMAPPQEPQSRIPAVVTVTEKEGRRFLQIR